MRETELVNLLIEKGLHISCGESCTGGMLTAALVNVPAASTVLNASVVTYANEAKIKYLSVSEKTIEEYGVVSEQVAAEMAKGAAVNNNAEIGVGISGVAGPGGGTEKKPVGMVCFGFYINGEVYTFEKKFGTLERNVIRKKSTEFAIDKLIELLS